METGIPEKRGPGRPPRKQQKNDVIGQILAEEPVQETKPIATPDNLTPEEKAIFGRVMAESGDWRTISEEESVDYSLSRDPFLPPEPALKLEQSKQFKFRWITRTPARLDEIKNKRVPFRWWPVNSLQPVGGAFKQYIDPNHGCVSREDQMLVFKPWWMFEKEREYKQGLADGADRAKSIENKDRETRKAGRDTDADVIAGKRKGTEDKQLRQEIKGSDVQYRGEEEADVALGRSTSMVSESDLTVEE